MIELTTLLRKNRLRDPRDHLPFLGFTGYLRVDYRVDAPSMPYDFPIACMITIPPRASAIYAIVITCKYR